MAQDLLIFLAGIAVGGINAIAGGGGILGFPVLMAAGLPPIVANATNHMAVIPGNLAAVFAYRKILAKVPRRFLWLIVPCLIGAAIGALILRNTSFSSFENWVPLLILFAVFLFAFQPLLHFHLHAHINKKKHKSIAPLIMFSLALLPLAVYGGYFGAGFGFLMLAFLGFTDLKGANKMNAIKNLGTLCISVATILCVLGTELLDIRSGLIMGAGNLIGGYYGAVGAQKASSHAIRIIVIVIGLATSIYLGIRAY